MVCVHCQSQTSPPCLETNYDCPSSTIPDCHARNEVSFTSNKRIKYLFSHVHQQRNKRKLTCISHGASCHQSPRLVAFAKPFKGFSKHNPRYTNSPCTLPG